MRVEAPYKVVRQTTVLILHWKKSGSTARVADVCCTSSDFKEVINVAELKISRNKNYS